MKGVLLVNLGSTEAPTPEAVKPFLDEFLMDKRVFDFPYWLRAFIVRGIILRRRPEKAAEAYKKIWWDEGSPITVISKRTHKKIDNSVDFPVSLAMRYGQPSIKTGLQELSDKGVTEVFLMGLYPQYAMSTTGTVEALAKKTVQADFPDMELSILPPFYDNANFIRNVADGIKNELKDFDYDCLLFSYHSLPVRHLRKTDKTGKHKKVKFKDGEYCCSPDSKEADYCYRTQCMETTSHIVERLNIPQKKYCTTFQSRLGIDKWITPFTADRVKELAQNGVKKLAIVAPSFVMDCVETLEELGMEAKDDFLANGGEEFRLVSCLNDDDEWIKTLTGEIEQWAKN